MAGWNLIIKARKPRRSDASTSRAGCCRASTRATPAPPPARCAPPRDGPTSWRTPASPPSEWTARRLTTGRALRRTSATPTLDALAPAPSCSRAGDDRGRVASPASRVRPARQRPVYAGRSRPAGRRRRLPADRLVPRSGLRTALSARCSARRMELRADAAGPRRHQAAVGAGPMPALAAARPGVSADRRRSVRASRSRASCATSWQANPIGDGGELGLHDGRRRCARRTGRSASSWCAAVAALTADFWRERLPGAVRSRRLHRETPREHLRGDQQSLPQQRRRPVLSRGGVRRSAARHGVGSPVPRLARAGDATCRCCPTAPTSSRRCRITGW